LDANCKQEVALFRLRNRLSGSGFYSSPELVSGAIIVPLGPSPGLGSGVLRAPHHEVESRCWVDSAEVAYDAN